VEWKSNLVLPEHSNITLFDWGGLFFFFPNGVQMGPLLKAGLVVWTYCPAPFNHSKLMTSMTVALVGSDQFGCAQVSAELRAG